MTVIWDLSVILSITTLFAEVSFEDFSTGILAEKYYYLLVAQRYQIN